MEAPQTNPTPKPQTQNSDLFGHNHAKPEAAAPSGESITVTYGRLSSDQIGDDAKHDRVHESAAQAVRRFKLPPIAHEFRDTIIQGVMPDRSGFQAMMALVNNWRDTFVVMPVERTFRDADHFFALKTLVAQGRVRLYGNTGPVPLELLRDGIHAYRPAAALSVRCRATGTAVPFGYLRRGRSLVPHGEEAVVVFEIFSLANQGRSTRQIVDYLNSSDAVAPRRRAWTSAAVHRILSKRIYCGQTVIRHPRFGEASITSTPWTAIVRPEWFELVQGRRPRRSIF